MTDPFTEARVTALAAGELGSEDAVTLRREMGSNPRLARLYGEMRGIHRALADFGDTAPDPAPELEAKILAATLPTFRRLYGRRTRYWPTWAAAAAAMLMVGLLQPGPVKDLAASFPQASAAITGLRQLAARQSDRARYDYELLRASLGVAIEGGMDEFGDRVRDFDRATRGPGSRDDAPGAPADNETPPIEGIAP